MSTDEYLVHMADLPSDLTKEELIEFFRGHGIEGANVTVMKKHYKIPTQWAKVSVGTSENLDKVVTTIKYPRVKHDIESRLLENFTDSSHKNVTDTNVVVKGLNKDKVDCAALDTFFTEKIGKIKSCKVSKTIEEESGVISCRSNGYGFVNFLTKEDADKAIDELNGFELEGSALIIERYNKDMKKETKFNNLYVRGFDESFSEEQLTKIFEPFGELGSIKIMTDDQGTSKKFGFVCYKESESATAAVEALHDKEMDSENTLYVAKFEKKANRWAALKKSLARSNLYVRNFDKNVTEEDLTQFFGGEKVVRNVRIMTTEVSRDGEVQKESKQFGFVSFNDPNDAAAVVLKYNNEELEFNNKQLYVNYYEDKGARKKRLANKKDKPEGLLGMLEGSAQGGDQNNMMKYFMEMFQQYFKSYSGGAGGPGGAGGYNNNGGQGYNNYGGQGYNNYGGQQHRRGGRNHRYPGGNSYNSYNQSNMYRGPPRADAQQSYANNAPAPQNMMPPTGGIPPTAGVPPTPVAPITTAPPASFAAPPQPTAELVYNNVMKTLMTSSEYVNADEELKREKIGEEIYNTVLAKAGDDNAPKITGMIIDLPFEDLISSVNDYSDLQEKIQEGLELLKEDQ